MFLKEKFEDGKYVKINLSQVSRYKRMGIIEG
jgi:hypothetical protein